VPQVYGGPFIFQRRPQRFQFGREQESLPLLLS
jgi:hypothetical protein